MYAVHRNIQRKLLEWRASEGRKPLVVRGARQVGKTTLVDAFGAEYGQYIKLNLEKAEHANIFRQFSEPNQIIDYLFLQRGLSADRLSETLLFIDEIQEVPEAMAMLRYFYEELGALHVISAGSLLEHAMATVANFPVGRIQFLNLFPFNFPEFLIAQGQDQLVERLHNVPVEKPVHHVAIDWFHKYAMVGGMPEIVTDYATHGSIAPLRDNYESIWGTYKEDVAKYARNNTESRIIRHIMNTAPKYLDQRITFENFGGSNYRSREVGESFRSLDAARVIMLIYPTTDNEPPVLPNLRKRPRLQFLDTGIVNHALGIHAGLMTVRDLSNAYKGALLPHLVTQEMISLNESSFHKPNFWVREKRTSQAEVDLVITKNGLLIPIEIKSGVAGTLRSLHQFVDRSTHPYAIRIYGGEFRIDEHRTPQGTKYLLMNLPYYLATWIDAYLQYFLSLKVGDRHSKN